MQHFLKTLNQNKMQVIKAIESADSFAERSAKDWEMSIRLSALLNSFINLEVTSFESLKEIKEIAEHYKLDLVLEKISKIK